MPEAPPAHPAAPRSPSPSRWLRWTSRRVEVHDRSMVPTLLPGDRLLVDRTAYRHRLPEVGDVVVLLDPGNSARWLVKRVAGVGPALYRRTRSGLVSGPPGPSEDEAVPPPDSVEKISLPEGTVYVQGDATAEARDSRQFGPVPLATLVGRAYRCYAPAGRARDLGPATSAGRTVNP